MSFDEFIHQVAKTKDSDCNAHLRSQSTMLCHDGRVLPQLVVPLRELGTGWAQVQQRVREHAGVDLPELPQRNSTAQVTAETNLTDELAALLRRRYAEDYRLLFRDS